MPVFITGNATPRKQPSLSLEGEGWFELDKHRYAVTANQFFILPKHQAHAYGSNERNPWTIYWIHFNGTKAAFFSAGFDRP